MAALANPGASNLVAGKVPGRQGNSHPTVAPYRAYDVADGQVIVGIGNDGQFLRLCDALGGEALKADPRFSTNALRVINRELIDALLEVILKGWKREDLIVKLGQATVPCGPINQIDDVFEDPHFADRGLKQNLERSDGTPTAVAGYPVKLSATPATYRHAPPPLGAVTTLVLREELKDLKTAVVISG